MKSSPELKNHCLSILKCKPCCGIDFSQKKTLNYLLDFHTGRNHLLVILVEKIQTENISAEHQKFLIQ